MYITHHKEASLPIPMSHYGVLRINFFEGVFVLTCKAYLEKITESSKRGGILHWNVKFKSAFFIL